MDEGTKRWIDHEDMYPIHDIDRPRAKPATHILPTHNNQPARSLSILFPVRDRQCHLPRRCDPSRLLCDYSVPMISRILHLIEHAFVIDHRAGLHSIVLIPYPYLCMVCHKSFRNHKKRLRSHRVHHKSVRCFIIDAARHQPSLPGFQNHFPAVRTA